MSKSILHLVRAIILILFFFPFISCSKVSYDAPKIGSSTVSFRTLKGVIIVKASINGKEGEFLYDNGFSSCALDVRFAKEIGAKRKGSASVNDGNNKQSKLATTKVKGLQIGKFLFGKTNYYILDTKKFFPCDSIDGVIGAPIINAVNWKINFEDSTLTLSDSPIIEKGYEIPIWFSSNNSTFINIKFENVSVKTKVDFGSSKGIELNYFKYKNLFLGDSVSNKVGVASLSVSGLGSPDTLRNLKDDYNINIGKHQFSGKIGLDKHQKYPGFVGMDWLNQFHVIVNSHQEKYILVPNKLEKEQKTKTYPLWFYVIDNQVQVIQKDIENEITSKFELLQPVQLLNQNGEIQKISEICDLTEFMVAAKKNDDTLRVKIEEDKVLEISKVSTKYTVLK